MELPSTPKSDCDDLAHHLKQSVRSTPLPTVVPHASAATLSPALTSASASDHDDEHDETPATLAGSLSDVSLHRPMCGLRAGLLDQIASELHRILRARVAWFPLSARDVRAHLHYALVRAHEHEGFYLPPWVCDALRQLRAPTDKHPQPELGDPVTPPPKVAMALERLDEECVRLSFGSLELCPDMLLCGGRVYAQREVGPERLRYARWLGEQVARRPDDTELFMYELPIRLPVEVLDQIVRLKPTPSIRLVCKRFRDEGDAALAALLARTKIHTEVRIFNGYHYLEDPRIFDAARSGSDPTIAKVSSADLRLPRLYVSFATTLPKHFAINRVTDFAEMMLIDEEALSVAKIPNKSIASHFLVGEDARSLLVPAYIIARLA
ncbi:hypothetical protein PYCC9005_005075 [Savitreella phatthalungensis]